MDKIKIITDGSCDLSHEVLNKFNINANLGLQRKNGDVILGSYGVFDKSIQVGYMINLKL